MTCTMFGLLLHNSFYLTAQHVPPSDNKYLFSVVKSNYMYINHYLFVKSVYLRVWFALFPAVWVFFIYFFYDRRRGTGGGARLHRAGAFIRKCRQRLWLWRLFLIIHYLSLAMFSSLGCESSVNSQQERWSSAHSSATGALSTGHSQQGESHQGTVGHTGSVRHLIL